MMGRVIETLIKLVLISHTIECRICGISEGLSGIFKHLQHKDSIRESCYYQIKTRDHLKVKLTFEKLVPCEKAMIKVVDEIGEHGPFCEELVVTKSILGVQQMMDMVFEGPEVKVIFMPGHHQRTMRMRVNFEWLAVTDGGIDCHTASLSKTDEMFGQIADQTRNSDAKSMWILLTKSISAFGQNFIADYQDFCKAEAANPECHLVELTLNDTMGTALNKMEMLIRHITTNCVKGFGYRWFDAFNRLAFLTGNKHVNNWTTGSEYEPVEHSDMGYINFENIDRTRTSQTTTSIAKTYITKRLRDCPWEAQNEARGACQVQFLEDCNLPVFEDSLLSKRHYPGAECDFREAVTEMSSIFSYLSALAANSGTFQNHCSSTKDYVPCSLLNLNTDNDKVFKPLTYIRKMKGMARKLTGDCDASHREEIASMFKHVWASLKVCGPTENTTDGLGIMIAERGLSIPAPPLPEPDFDLDKPAEREKKFCRIEGYHGRNVKTFVKRVGSSHDPKQAIAIFKNLSARISNLGEKVTTMPSEVCFLDGREGDRVPCELAYIPKNEEACQLANRIEEITSYISKRCPILLGKDIHEKVTKLQNASKPKRRSCPALGTPMTREVRLAMSDL